MLVKQILYHWPEKTLRVTEIRRSDMSGKSSSSERQKSRIYRDLIAAYFKGLGCDERRVLRSIDLRGIPDRDLKKLEEYRGVFTDPFFRNKPDCESIYFFLI